MAPNLAEPAPARMAQTGSKARIDQTRSPINEAFELRAMAPSALGETFGLDA